MSEDFGRDAWLLGRAQRFVMPEKWPWESDMAERKIKVPEGMLKAAYAAWDKQGAVDLCVVAALRWLAENPIVPTSHSICAEMHRTINAKGYCCYQSALLAEWQRRMFLESETEAISDLLWHHDPGGDCNTEHNKQIREAYRRGKEGK